MNGILTVRIKEILHSAGNTIYLRKGSNTKKSNADTKERKDLCKPFPVLSHTLFYVIKRSANNVPVLSYHTILNG